VTVGTIFHNTKLPLQKWFMALSLIINAKKGIAARQLARYLKVRPNTAWRISMKIREAMKGDKQQRLLEGLIEMDETYIGGKPRKTRKQESDGMNYKAGRGTKKIPVIGIIERYGQVRVSIISKKKVNFKHLSSLVRKEVNISKSVLVTDQAQFYKRMRSLMTHKTVNHSIEYTKGWIHTNSIESFWALLKRGIVGQFHKVSVKYLNSYLNEFAYRFNNRHNGDLFEKTMQKAVSL